MNTKQHTFPRMQRSRFAAAFTQWRAEHPQAQTSDEFESRCADGQVVVTICYIEER